MKQILGRTHKTELAALLMFLLLATSPLYGEGFGGGGFESRLENLQNKFINVLLPIASILGLSYAGILAATGNEGAKGKFYIILLGSIFGFLAPHLISWLKAALT